MATKLNISHRTWVEFLPLRRRENENSKDDNYEPGLYHFTECF